jgi:hypothetical protein
VATAVKTARTLQASASNGAGSTTTGSAVNLTTALGMTVTAKVTNGGTGPTVGCTFSLEISNDNSAWKTYVSALAPTTNSAVTEWAYTLGPEIMYVRSKFSGNTGQAVTVEAFGHELTSIG